MKLHGKILTALLPLVTIPIAILGWIAYNQQKESIELEAVARQQAALQQVDEYFQARLEALRSNALLFSKSRDVEHYMLVEDEAQRYRLYQSSLLGLFSTYLQANPDYFEIRILLPDGYEDSRAVSHYLKNVSDEEGEQAYFRSMLGNQEDTLVQVIKHPDTAKPAILASRRIALVDPSIDPVLAAARHRGFLVISLNPDFLAEKLERVKQGGLERLVIFGAGGTYLHDTASPGKATAIETELYERSHNLSPDGVTFWANIGGESSLVHLRPTEVGLVLGTLLPERSMLTGTRSLQQATLLVIVSAILLTTGLMIILIRFLMLKPLQRLQIATKALAQGQPVKKLPQSNADEIGELTQSFQAMSSQLVRSHERISELAFRDSLTGLSNRRFFVELLKRAMSQAERQEQLLALLFLDIDDFKKTNDTQGHTTGDALLSEVARRLTEATRLSDEIGRKSEDGGEQAVARLGGDEFTVLLSGLETARDAAAVAARISAAFSKPFLVNEMLLSVSFSIGITLYPRDGNSAEILLKNADLAMYQAKASGKNTYRFFTSELDNAFRQRVRIESAIEQAIQENQLVVHYQPQIELLSGRVVGSEALVRWNHPDRGLLSPVDFIPIAEESGLITGIDIWVLKEACRQSKEWQNAGMEPVPVAVNISSRDLTRSSLYDSVREALQQSDLDPRYLTLELTETAIMEDVDRAAESFSALQSLGVQIAMDDFGTGYSSLGALRTLPIDYIKIDRSFVSDIGEDENDAAIISAIIAMGRSLDLKVLAEGVENEAQYDFLLSRQCQWIQGFLIGKPLGSEQFLHWYRARGVLKELVSAND